MDIKITNLGDVNPLDYGGYFLLERSGEDSGNYLSEECVVIELLEGDDDELRYFVYRFIPELCYFEKQPNENQGVLSDNKYHKNIPAWFAGNILDYRDDFDSWIDDITSNDPISRALAYQDIGEYYGWENLDSYPLEMTRKEIVKWMVLPAYRLNEYAE